MLRQIVRYQKDTEALIVRGRPVPKGNIHLTLHFIGEIDFSEVDEFAGYLEKAAAGFRPFSITFPSFGSFRQGRRELVYLSVGNAEGNPGHEEMSAFSADLKRLSRMGDTKPFRPHITLIRNAEIEGKAFDELKNRRHEKTVYTCDTAAFMESVYLDGTLTYVPLHTVRLGTGSSKREEVMR